MHLIISKENLSGRKAFTLLELLISISIVGLLAVLIFPTVRSSIQKSQSAVALNNLRTIGRAVLSYAADNNSTMIPVYFHIAGDSSGNADRAWIHELVMNGYVEDRISYQESPGKWVNTDDYQNLVNPITRKMHPEASASGGFGLNAFSDLFEGIKMSSIKSPTKTIMAADASFKNGWFDWGLGDVDGVVNCYPNTLSSGYAHYLFCDGHTEKIKAKNPNQTDSLPVGYNETVFFKAGD